MTLIRHSKLADVYGEVKPFLLRAKIDVETFVPQVRAGAMRPALSCHSRAINPGKSRLSTVTHG